MAKDQVDHEDEETEHDDKTAEEAEQEDSNWGFAQGKPKMAKETKIGLALILVLLAAFSFVVYKKLNPNNKLLAQITKKIETLKPKDASSVDLSESDLLGSSSTEIDSTEISSADQDPFGNSKTTDHSFATAQNNSVQTTSRSPSETSNPFGSSKSSEIDRFSAEQNESSFDADQREPQQFAQQPQQNNSVSRDDPFGANTQNRSNPYQSNSGQNPQQRQSSESTFGLDDESENSFGNADQTEQPDIDRPVAQYREQDKTKQSTDTEYNPFEPESDLDSSSMADQQEKPAAKEVTDLFGNPIRQKSDNRQDDLNRGTKTFTDQDTGTFDQPSSNQASQQNSFTKSNQFSDPGDRDSNFTDERQQNSTEQNKYGQYQAVETGQESASSSTYIKRPEAEDSTTDTFENRSTFSENRSNEFDSGNSLDNSITNQSEENYQTTPSNRSTYSDTRSTMSQPDIDQSIDVDQPFSQQNQSQYGSTRNESNGRSRYSQNQNSSQEDPFDSSTSNPGYSYGQSSSEQTTRSFGSSTESSSDFGQTYQQQSETTGSYSRKSFGNESTTPRSTGSDIYVIEPNDSYWKISKKQYGTARYFQALAMYNKERIPNPRRMRPGMKILTPSREALESRYPKLFPARSASTTDTTIDRQSNSAFASSQRPTQNGPAGFFNSSEGQPMYRIGRLDTLSEISQKHLGRSSRWIQIFRMNQDRLQDPHNLKVGTVLRLPADASRISLLKRSGNVR